MNQTSEFKIKVTGDASSASTALQRVVAGMEQVDRVLTRISSKTGKTSFTISGSKNAAPGAAGAAASIPESNSNLLSILNRFTPASRKISTEAQNTSTQINKVFNQIGKSYSTVTGYFTKLSNDMRYVSQGAQELARTLSTSLAIPLAYTFMKAYSTATEFESAMVRVRKTTQREGETSEEAAARVEKLSDDIRQLALYTASSQVELAGYAEQLGQTGVVDTNAFSRLIRVVEMLQMSTDIAADSVAEDMGQISAAFGWNLNTETGVKNVENLADVINYLENTTATSAGSIVSGLLNVAGVGSMLDAPAEELATLVAYMESAGVSAESTGTRLSTWYTQIISNTEEFANLMRGFKDDSGVELYADAQDVVDRLNADPILVFTDAMKALNSTADESKQTALAEYFDIFGRVAGKTGVLQGNIVSLADALDKINDGAAEGSLWNEYNQALMTTEVHTKVLQNNISELALSLGDTFLPVINRIAEYAIPVVQALGEAFKGLDWNVKLAIVGVPLLTIALAPVLLLVSSLMHSLTLFAIGISGAFRNAGSIAIGLGKLVVQAGSLISKTAVTTAATAATAVSAGAAAAEGVATAASAAGTAVAAGADAVAEGAATAGTAVAASAAAAAPAIGSVVAIAAAATAAVVGVMKVLSNMGVNFSGWFEALANSASSWGENLMRTYSGGLIAGAARYVTQAITSIANLIASFFESHSPPEDGPLATIDSWGSNLINTYLQGFALADFSILSDVGGRIKSALQAFSDLGQIDSSSVNTLVLNARTNISKLLSTFNATGEIAESVLSSIGSNLGSLGKDIQKLTRLWIEYKQIQQAIADLEARKEDTYDVYDAEIARVAALNVSAEEKAELMRQAMRSRDDELRTIEEELEVQEDASDAKEDELDWQKEYVDAQIDQLELMKQLEDTVSSVAGSLGDLSSLDFENLATSIDSISDPVQAASDRMTELQKRIESARTAVGQLIAGFKGEGFGEGINLRQWATEDPEGYAEARKLYDVGKQAQDAWQQVRGTVEKVNNIFSIFHRTQSAVEGTVERSSVVIWANKVLDGFSAMLDPFSQVSQGFDDLMASADRLFESLGGHLDIKKLLEANQKFLIGLPLLIMGVLTAVLNILGDVAGTVMTLISNVLDYVGTKIDAAKQYLSGSKDVLSGIFHLDKDQIKRGLKTAFDAVLKMLGADMGLLVTNAGALAGGLAQILLDASRVLVVGLLNFFGLDTIAEAVNAWFGGAKEWVSKAWGNLKNFVANLGKGSGVSLGPVLASVLASVGNFFVGLLESASYWFGFILGSIIAGVVTFTQETIPQWVDSFQQWVDAAAQTLGNLIGAAVQALGNMLASIGDWFANNYPIWKEKFTQLVEKAMEALSALIEDPLGTLDSMLGSINQWFALNLPIWLGLFESWVKAIPSAMSDLATLLIDQLRSALDAAIKWWNDHVSDKFDLGFSVGLGTGTSSTSSNTVAKPSETRDDSLEAAFASGGIVTRATRALVGEGGEPEAIIPLSQLPGMLDAIYSDQLSFAVPERSVESAAAPITVQINNPNVRSDADIREIARQVERVLAKKTYASQRMGL